jgi:hypothetical protein
MRKLAMLAVLVVGGAVAAGCGSGPCDRMHDYCNKCSDSQSKKACNDAANLYSSAAGGDASCQAAIDANAYNCN